MTAFDGVLAVDDDIIKRLESAVGSGLTHQASSKEPFSVRETNAFSVRSGSAYS